MSAESTYDAIIIGGGVIGASCAWHLLDEGITDVLLLEKDRPASKASGRASGHLSTYTSRKYEAAIRRYCIDFHREIAANHENVKLHEDTDHVLAHTDRGAERLAELQQLDTERLTLLTREELTEQETVFNTDAVVAALVYDQAVHTDPYSLTTSLVAEAEAAGATLLLEGVTDIEHDNEGSGFSVVTDVAIYEAETVINAGGAWSGRIAEMLDVSIPVKPRTSQIAVLETQKAISMPMFHCPDIGLYGRQELNGDILVGGGIDEEIPDPDRFTTNAREEFVQYVSEQCRSISEALDDSRLVNDWAGRCTATPDRQPLIGQTSVPGFYVCAGFNGGGVARSPFAGRLIAELVTGAKPSFATAPYDPGRFTGEESFEVKSASTDW
jgi:sarcosine oxidase subunit beta